MSPILLAIISALVGLFTWLTLGALRWVCGRGPKFVAVARNVIDEASRKRIAVVVFVVAIAFVSIVAWGLDPGDSLLFRIRNLLTYGIGGVVTSGMVMTIVLGCGSVASEIEEKQIYTTLTKPLGRMMFLAGKWLGVFLLDLVLLLGCGVHLLLLTQALVSGCEDTTQVAEARSQVLSAHVGIPPNDSTDPRARERFEEHLPEFARRNARRRQVLGTEEFYEYAWERFLDERRLIPPGRGRPYVFDGVRSGPAALHIRARMVPPPLGDQIEALITIESEPARTYILGIGKTTVIQLADRTETGSASIRIQFPDTNAESPIDLTEPHALEIVQPATSFGNNLARGLLIFVVKFAFVTALAVFMASFLSFPVATLTVVLVTVVATSSDYLIASSLEPGGTLYQDRRGGLEQPASDHSHSHGGHTHSHAEPDVDLVDATLDQIERFGLAIARVLRKYGELSPIMNLVDGRVVPMSMVAEAFGWIGLIWTGGVAGVAWVVMRRRELARVQV